jgi:hypothetical protein
MLEAVKRGAWLVLGLAAAGAMVFAYLQVRPRGGRIGELDLRAGAAVEIDARAGDRLSFPAHITIGLAGFQGTAKQRARVAVDALKRSQLTVRVAPASGRELRTTCALWLGSMDSDIADGALTESQIANDCAVEIATEGRHQIRATVAWAPELSDVRRARLELRREDAAAGGGR